MYKGILKVSMSDGPSYKIIWGELRLVGWLAGWVSCWWVDDALPFLCTVLLGAYDDKSLLLI